jgi:hypothetical protein
MADTRAMVRRALDLFKPYLREFVDQHLRNAYGPGYLERVPRLRQRHEPDVQALLSIMLQHWNDAFTPVLAARDRTLIFELKDVRNRWAHEHEFSLDDAYRGVDTIELLADGIGAGTIRPRLAAMKEEIRLLQATPRSNAKRDRPPPAPGESGGPAPAQQARSHEGHHNAADPDSGGLDWLGDEGDDLRSAFAKVFGGRARPFGKRSTHIGGVSDDEPGVQWNAGFDPRDGRQWVGVNLEGKKYVGWPIARLLERELSSPTLLDVVRQQPELNEVLVLVKRDYWPAGNRADIREAFIAPTPIMLGKLTAGAWRQALAEAIDCLDASRDRRGRAVQKVTLLSGVVKEGPVTPHLTFEWHASEPSDWASFFREARQRMQPLHDWASRRAAEVESAVSPAGPSG